MIAKSISEAIYHCIFPGGMIPIACKSKLPALDACITELESLLRDIDLPQLELKKEAYDALTGQAIIEAHTDKDGRTDLEFQSYAERAERKEVKPAPSPAKVHLTEAQKSEVLELHAGGMSHQDIQHKLRIDGRQVVGVIRGQEQRERMAAIAAKKPRAEKTTQPNATPPELVHKPNPQLDYHEVADAKIINMKKRGMVNHEIAQVLERNPGGRWDTQKVDARWTELKRQGLA